MKQYKFISLTIVAIALLFNSSCIKNKDMIPLDPDVISSATVFDNPEAYKQFLAKIYAGYVLSGQQGPSGDADITGIDEGFSTYLRQLWKAQELTTEEAVISWNDGNLRDYHDQDWTSANEFVKTMYNRIFYQITLANEYIRETADGKISWLTAAQQTEVKYYRAEARFLRAYSYWHAIDMFGNVPFVTEADKVGAFLPKQISRADLFTYLESELIAVAEELKAPKTNEYGRVDKTAAWMLLAKLYLNAKVYTGTPKYTECLTYIKQVIGAGYTLDPVYANMFLADNNKSPEIFFSFAVDGQHSQSWGGMTFLVHAQVGGSMDPKAFGIDGGWSGLRVTKTFVEKFQDITGNTDKRAMFYTNGQKLEIADLFTFTDGYAITKFKNVTSTGVAGSSPAYPDTDYPVFRLADAYLMYAEAVLSGGTGGDATTALGYVNALRTRAYGNASGNISAGELNLNFILDERARELYWEGHRRTDLIRFGKFSNTTYIWPWKGGVAAGASVNEKYDIFPIPATDLSANQNLKQNTGY